MNAAAGALAELIFNLGLLRAVGVLAVGVIVVATVAGF